MAATATTIITDKRREKLCKITSGATTTIGKITHVAFGDAGVDAAGEPLAPRGTQTELNHEVGRYAIDAVSYPLPTTACYVVTIPREALPGVKISEAALVDADGDLATIKNMYAKGKDADVTFTLTFEDEF